MESDRGRCIVNKLAELQPMGHSAATRGPTGWIKAGTRVAI